MGLQAFVIVEKEYVFFRDFFESFDNEKIFFLEKISH